MYLVFEKKRCALQANERMSVTENTMSLFTDRILLFHQWRVVSCLLFFIDFPYAYAHRCDDFTLVFECYDGISWENDIFFSIFIRWSTIMWWITTSRGLPRSNVECKADSIFLLRLHAWCMYSLKLTSESILANWNHEPNSIFLSFFLPSGVCVCALFNLNLAADLAWNCAYSQCIHKFNSALASFCALRFFD